MATASAFSGPRLHPFPAPSRRTRFFAKSLKRQSVMLHHFAEVLRFLLDAEELRNEVSDVGCRREEGLARAAAVIPSPFEAR